MNMNFLESNAQVGLSKYAEITANINQVKHARATIRYRERARRKRRLRIAHRESAMANNENILLDAQVAEFMKLCNL